MAVSPILMIRSNRFVDSNFHAGICPTIDVSTLVDVPVDIMFGPCPGEVPLDDHLLLMVNVRIIQGVLEILPQSVTGLYLRVQSSLPLGSVDGGPDAIVTSRDQLGVRFGFDEPVFDVFPEQFYGPCSKKRVASSLPAHVESRLQTDGYGNRPA